MLQNTTDSKQQGFASSINLAILTLGGLISTTALGIIQQNLNAPDHINVYGETLALFIGVSYILSTPFYFLAGLEYAKFRRKKDEALIEVASFDGNAPSIKSKE